MTARQVGWCAAAGHCSDLLFPAPEMLKPEIPCPAISAWCTRSFVLRAPYDIDLVFDNDAARGPALRWGEHGPKNDVYESFALVAPERWPAADTPIVLWDLRQVFVADGPCALDTCAPFLHGDSRGWPGTVLPQRFRPDRVVRPVNWAFLWQEPHRPLRLRRGDPIQYARFNMAEAHAAVRLRPIPFSNAVAAALAGDAAAVHALAGSLSATA